MAIRMAISYHVMTINPRGCEPTRGDPSVITMRETTPITTTVIRLCPGPAAPYRELAGSLFSRMWSPQSFDTG